MKPILSLTLSLCLSLFSFGCALPGVSASDGPPRGNLGRPQIGSSPAVTEDILPPSLWVNPKETPKEQILEADIDNQKVVQTALNDYEIQ